MRNTDPQSNFRSSAPASRGPSAADAPPIPDHNAIDLVLPGPDQSAVISARVVGKAMPAAIPPPTRARKSMSAEGANAASSEKGIASAVPSTSIFLRP